MKRVIVFLIILCLILLCGCSNKPPINLDINQIERIEFGTIKTYYPGENENEIEAFVALFNRSTRYTDDAGTTHPCMTIIYLKDKTTIEIWSGAQGFLTIGYDNTQFNIKNDELDSYLNNIAHSD